MIQLHSFGENFGVPDPSPFVFKIDVYLRMANIAYKSNSDPRNLGKSPKGKLPFIKDGDKIVADSQFIIDYLKEKYNVDLDSSLTEEQKSIAYLLGKSLDENLYWCVVYSRWACDDTWPLVNKAFFSTMPFPLKYIVPIVARKSVLNMLDKHGMGKHSHEEIKKITKKSVHALSNLLGDKKFFFGDTPCTFDATAFSLLSELISVTFDNEFNQIARSYDNLVSYCDTMKSKYYEDNN